MSMVQELIAAVSSAEREIDEQVGRLRSYQNEVDSVSERVEAALSGSSQDYNRKMLDQLRATKSQIDATLASLRGAKEQLLHVRMI